MSRKIEALQEAAAQKSSQAAERVEKALSRMIKEGQVITFSSVAQSANVCVAYLYKQPEIRARIETLRAQQKQQNKVNRPPSASDNSKNVMIQTLREENKKLRKEIEEGKRLNETLTGRLYQIQGADNLAERLKGENQKLVKKNQELSEKLTKAFQELEEYKRQAIEANSKVTSIQKRSKTEIDEAIKTELEQLKIPLNSTLRKKIKEVSVEQVLTAIEALKEQLKGGTINNPGGWLASAIEQGWSKPEAIEPPQPVYTPTERIIPSDKPVLQQDKLTAKLQQLNLFGE